MTKDIYKTGVYQIRNLINDKIYIGSTALNKKTKSMSGFYRRFEHHKQALRTNTHHNSHLQRAWNKYGEESFRFLILSTCPPEYCIKLEQWFINNLKPNYNICKIAGSCKGRITTEQHRQNLSKSLKNREITWGAKISEANRNNLERNKKISESYHKMSEEQKVAYHAAKRDKQRLHPSVKLNVESVIQIKQLLKGNVRSCEIAKTFNISRNVISSIKLGKTWKDIII